MYRAELLTSYLTHSKKESPRQNVLQHFAELARIPRTSGEEAQARKFVVDFAQSHGFAHEVDSVGNVLIEVPATAGKEKVAGVVLQAHLDMVCLGEPDPAKFGVQPIVDDLGEWMSGRKTTLGADNGIGVAVALSLAEEKIAHGPVALMFTVDEEMGMKGAQHMSFQHRLEGYRFLLNFDSETEGEANFSSAGMGESVMKLPAQQEKMSPDESLIQVSLTNLPGGHSGVDIHEGRPNSIKVMTELLRLLATKTPVFRIAQIEAGTRRNAIPSEAKVVVALSPHDLPALFSVIEVVQNALPQLKIESEHLPVSDAPVYTEASTLAMIEFLRELPHGVVKWSQEVPGMVQTSTNLAVARAEAEHLLVEMSTRSASDVELREVRASLRHRAEAKGAQVTDLPASSGWQTDIHDPLIEIVKKTWSELTESELKLVAIHAGLECGQIVSIYKQLSALSIGPTIEEAHTIRERVNIQSIERFYLFARGVLQAIAEL